ncbi:hypothetical protein JG687_00005649 [Phytophthora cactorum]|uniref:Uncharacterized protein n=1 Tax=Phytophthora cactorum TaxID=29920 RepID=A0A329SIP0_9STRA|nr:hypothetical protein JG687_00005649 [Phytophthora cactorum]RAW36673.1 hypothetical protein PC110_g7057 [Phytophthora cactorum]
MSSTVFVSDRVSITASKRAFAMHTDLVSDINYLSMIMASFSPAITDGTACLFSPAGGVGASSSTEFTGNAGR